MLVATPIGNLGDLPPRAVQTLQQSALILCEDTRHSGKLLAHAGVSGVRLAVCNEHTELERARDALTLLDGGATVAMITDAGTPGISDPGSRLVRAVLDAGHQVLAVPGPAAFVMALVVSGFDTTRFVFEGFLPRTDGTSQPPGGNRRRAVHDRRLRGTTPHRAPSPISPRRAVVNARRPRPRADQALRVGWRGSLDEALTHCARRRHVSTSSSSRRRPAHPAGRPTTTIRAAFASRTARRRRSHGRDRGRGRPTARFPSGGVYDLALTRRLRSAIV